MARQSISRLISARAAARPDEVIVCVAGAGSEASGPNVTGAGSEAMTADQLDRAGNRLARHYRALGVDRDDLVTVALPTSIEFVVACTAIWKLGATPQPLAPEMTSNERAELERLARPKLVIGSAPSDTSIAWVSAGHQFDNAVSDAALPDAWASCWKAPTSSGSSGRPKIVRSTAPALFDPADSVAQFLPRRAVQLVTSPLWHSASFTYAFRGLMTDHRLVLAERFDEREFGGIVETHGITWTLLSPNMVHRLVRLGDAALASIDTTSIESVLHLGAPCPEDDKRALIGWLGADRVLEVYAGSESNGLTAIRGDEWLSRPRSVGRPIGGTEIAILDEFGSELTIGTLGQIWMRRTGDVRYTYVGGDSRRTDDGWDTLGDIGFVDADGFLTIVDRQSDTITCADTTLYPARMEQGIVSHPAVRDAVVFGVRGRAGEQRISAVVDIADSEVDPAAVELFALRHLAGYCRTGGVSVGRRPLRNDAGKIRRSSFAADAAIET